MAVYSIKLDTLLIWLNENVLMNRRNGCPICYGLHRKKQSEIQRFR